MNEWQDPDRDIGTDRTKGVALGAAAGMIAGAALGNPGVGMVLGAACGLILGPALVRKLK